MSSLGKLYLAYACLYKHGLIKRLEERMIETLLQRAAIFSTLLLTLIVYGCVSSSNNSAQVADSTPSKTNRTQRQSPAHSISDKLYAQHHEWKGTQYAMGRISRQGIDCSGFVFVTFRDQFGISIPRATKHQSQLGNKVKRSQLRAGDLLFFKTRSKVRHVGIYIEDDKFLHVSTKKGVKISSLNNDYWQSKYWQARRIPLT